MMRISGGHLKGRRIASRKVFSAKRPADELRPTSSKVREALFDILQTEIQGAAFLDLYAGTGAVGMEALSRGAESVTLVEKDTVRCQAINHYANELKLSYKLKCYREKVEYFVKRASVAGASFDIVFADPPYSSDAMDMILDLMGEYDIIRERGCLIVEHSARKDIPEEKGRLRLVRSYRYGDTILSLFRKEL